MKRPILERRRGAKKNSVKNSGPQRDERGRLHGGNPGNRGGQKGRSGRRPEEFKRWCGNQLHDQGKRQAIMRVLRDANHPHFAKMWVWIASYGADRPPEELNLNVRDRREHALNRILDELDAIAKRQKA